MEGIAEKDEPFYIHVAFSNHLRGNPAAQGLPGCNDGRWLVDRMILEKLAHVHPCRLQHTFAIRRFPLFITVEKVEPHAQVPCFCKNICHMDEQRMEHAVAGSMSNYDPGALPVLKVIRHGYNAGDLLVLPDRDKYIFFRNHKLSPLS